MLDMTTPLRPVAFMDAPHVAPAMIAVELEGSASARVDGVLFPISAHRARSGVTPKVARALIAEGRDPATVVRVTRGATQVFRDAPLSAWAGLTVEEGDGTSARFRRYDPHGLYGPKALAADA